jgi:hypothetical protein
LSDALKYNTTLTSLNLGGSQIGDDGAKDLSGALKHNTTLTSLELGFNKISAAGAKDLSDALKHNTTLTSLNLRDNQIGGAQLKEINALIERNHQMMLARRQQFIYKMILLARNAKSSNSASLWSWLPKDIRYYILESLSLNGEAYIGKTRKQVYQCTRFIFDHIEECNEVIKAKQKIKLIEKETANGNYQFCFFKSPAFINSQNLHKAFIIQQMDQVKPNENETDKNAIHKHVILKPGSQ